MRSPVTRSQKWNSGDFSPVLDHLDGRRMHGRRTLVVHRPRVGFDQRHRDAAPRQCQRHHCADRAGTDDVDAIRKVRALRHVVLRCGPDAALRGHGGAGE
jgi:hypothetical protein